MRAVIEVFQQWLEELAQRVELPGVQQVTGIEYHGLEPGPVAWNPGLGYQRFRSVAVDLLGEFAGQCADPLCQRAAADQQRTLDRPEATRFPALQSNRRRQAQSTDHAVAER
ncbi:hypothetical protein D3C73_1250020 [compost metagenome]